MGGIKEKLRQELESKDHNLKKRLKKHEVDVLEQIPPPEVAIELKDNTSESYSILGTLGNFSLVKGKAKSKKSFFINLVVATATGQNLFQNKLRSPKRRNKANVLYFDTEQSKYHLQLAVKRICRQLQNELPNNLFSYGLRKEKPKDRLELIEYAVANTPNLGFVVIDGVRDLITSINDESEASEMASNLLKWTEEYGIHIIVVLHENPGSEKARGHLGTELTNKAETVVTIAVDNENENISIVSPGSCRNKPFDPFAFEINEKGMPIVLPEYQVKLKQSKNKKLDLIALDVDQQLKIIKTAFSAKTELKYNDLKEHIKNAIFVIHKKPLGENKIKEFISYLKEEGVISQSAERKPYTLSKL